jgi:quaternary ammonium compound-resistance protein SugE
MNWVLLTIAGLFEVGWAVGMKYSEGFTRPVPTALTVVALIISMVLLALAVRDLPVGTAYAVWTGIGAAGTAILGMWLFDESRDPVRLVCLSLVVVGVLGLKFAGK